MKPSTADFPRPENYLHSLNFVAMAAQYYVLGRLALTHKMHDVAPWILHMAVEYFIKSGLVMYLDVQALRQKPYVHDLERLWGDFKANYNLPSSKDLQLYSDCIQDLQKFYVTRYPNGKPDPFWVSINLPDDPLISTEASFRLDTFQLDRLVLLILENVPNNGVASYFGKYAEARALVDPPFLDGLLEE
ncbi:MAG: hypothetical protein KF828_02780 [Anaerolineales bacterium]|nr:hypothetical protein [Anaerolineales bacterium]